MPSGKCLTRPLDLFTANILLFAFTFLFVEIKKHICNKGLYILLYISYLKSRGTGLLKFPVRLGPT